jgi:hypothetical protein
MPKLIFCSRVPGADAITSWGVAQLNASYRAAHHEAMVLSGSSVRRALWVTRTLELEAVIAHFYRPRSGEMWPSPLGLMIVG